MSDMSDATKLIIDVRFDLYNFQSTTEANVESLITTIESQKEEIEKLYKDEVIISFTCVHCEGTGYNDVSGSTGIEDDVDSCEECDNGSNDVKFTHEDIVKMYLALQQYADESNWVHEDVWDGGGNPCSLAQSALSHIQEGDK